MYYTWKNKKETLDGMISCGISKTYYGLPLALSPIFGRFNSDLTTKSDGSIELVKIKSKGWCLEVGIYFLCFYLCFEINRWYWGKDDKV